MMGDRMGWVLTDFLLDCSLELCMVVPLLSDWNPVLLTCCDVILDLALEPPVLRLMISLILVAADLPDLLPDLLPEEPLDLLALLDAPLLLLESFLDCRDLLLLVISCGLSYSLLLTASKLDSPSIESCRTSS